MKTKGIILAGGKGERLKTKNEKIFTKIKNKTLIDHAIHKLKSVKLEVHIVTRPDLKNKIKNQKKIYVQKRSMGTGHALSIFLKNNLNFKNCLVINSDTPFIHKNDLKRVLNFKDKADLILLSYKNKNNKSNGVILKDSHAKYIIKEFIHLSKNEKKNDNCFSGILLFNKKISKEFLKIKKDFKKDEYLITDILKTIYNKKYKVKILKSRYPELCQGINTKEDMLLVKKNLKK
tara:strand:+ start:8210 stop:8908 length:699 start_codon:yes stop_codon:yes gene_type:complete